MKKNILLIIMIIFFGLTACGGGGGSSGNDPHIQPQRESVSLSPLKIQMLDLNNNPIPYIDISKIGSHTIYKLQFTNINSVYVYALGVGTVADGYAAVQAQNMGITLESYMANYQPPAYEYGFAIKTNNADDCFNHMESFANGASNVKLEPEASCSYYTYAINISDNYSNNDTFTVPVSYSIYNPDLRLNLDVVQCITYDFPPNPATYNCDNMSKPGFSGQFITYKMLPFNGTSNFPIYNSYGNEISPNGNSFWSCQIMPDLNVICSQYALNYNSVANTLTLANTPESAISIAKSYGQDIKDLYPSLDGSNVWVSSYSNSTGFYLVNTTIPNMLFTSDCLNTTHCVPNINTSLSGSGINNGLIGLDGSFWWSTQNGMDVYNPSAQTFVHTNIGRVIGVNADGTVIGFANGIPGCWTAGADYNSYVYRGPLLNYANPNLPSSIYAYGHGQNVYMTMRVAGIYAYNGIGTALTADYKVHTENGLCQINLDDYTYYLRTNSQYTLTWPPILSNPQLVAPSANVYSGL